MSASAVVNSEETFTVFFHEHRRPLRAYISKVYPAFDADDVTAATFTVAWSRFGDIPQECPRAWLIGTARNVVRNQARADRRRTQFVDRLVFDRPRVTADMQDDWLLTEQVQQLETAMASLSKPDQELLLMAAWAELSVAEIGVALGISTNAATVRGYRARQRLRTAMQLQTAPEGRVG